MKIGSASSDVGRGDAKWHIDRAESLWTYRTSLQKECGLIIYRYCSVKYFFFSMDLIVKKWVWNFENPYWALCISLWWYKFKWNIHWRTLDLLCFLSFSLTPPLPPSPPHFTFKLPFQHTVLWVLNGKRETCRNQLVGSMCFPTSFC
jgi:hypothetical protein